MAPPPTDPPSDTRLREPTGDPTPILPEPGDAAAVSHQRFREPRYAGGRLLGQGGMGTVALEHDRWLGRDVARKRLKPERTDPHLVHRFLLEARVMGRLEHPNIVPVYDLGQDEGGPWIAMRRVQGESLRDLVDEGRLGTEVRRLELFGKVCDALAYAHARGVVHRDVKPANVMVGQHGEILLLDWGCARIVGDPAEPGPVEGPAIVADTVGVEITREDVVIGTPGYMAPEQAEGRVSDVDERTDVHALGALLRVLLSAAPGGGSEALPTELAAIVEKATANRPQDRFQSVGELRDAILAYQEERELPFVRYAGRERIRKWGRRHRRGLVVAAAVVFVATGLVAAVTGIDGMRLRSALERATAAEREAELRLARGEVAAALVEAEDGRVVEARERLRSARRMLGALGEPLGVVDLAESRVAEVSLPPSLAVRVPHLGALALSPDGSRILVVPTEGDAFVLSALDGGTTPGPRAPSPGAVPRAAAWQEGRAVVAWESGGRLVGIDDLGRTVADVPSGPPGATTPVLTPEAWLVPLGEQRGTRLHRLDTGEIVMLPEVAATHATADGRRVLGTLGGVVPIVTPTEVAVWDAEASAVVWRAPFPSWGMDLAPDGQHVVMVDDGRMAVVDVRSGATVASVPARVGAGAVWSGDGSTIVMVDHEEAQFFSAPDLRSSSVTPMAGATLRSWALFEVDGGGRTVVSLRPDLLTVWRRPGADPGRRLRLAGDVPRTVAVSPDGALVAAAGSAGVVQVHDLSTGVLLRSWPTDPAGTRDLAFLPDGSAVVSAEKDGRVRWQPLDGAEGPRALETGCALCTAVAPLDARSVVVGCASGELVALDVDGRELWRVDTGLGSLWDVARSEATGHIVVSSRDGRFGEAALVDPRTRAVVVVLPAPRVAYRVAASGDGEWFAVADHYGGLTRVAVRPPHATRFVAMSQEVLMAVAWSDDGAILAGGDYAGAVHLWDAVGDRPLGSWSVHGGAITDLAFVPGSHVLVTAAADGEVRSLDLALGSVVPLVEAPGPPDAARTAALAHLAEVRGDWDAALELGQLAAARGGTFRAIDETRALYRLGRPERARSRLDAAAATGEISPGTAAAWRAALR